MTSPRRRPFRRHPSDERGAALVEFALVLPFLALLLFGTIEFGIAFNDYQSIRQGAREGAREAVVQGHLAASNSCGLNGGATTAPDNFKKIMCLTKDRTGLGNDVRVRVEATLAASDFRDHTLKVCVTRNVNSITGLLAPFIDDVPLQSSIEMRAERPLELGATNASHAETDPSGENWAWC